jgi:thiol-disulfide isomerase/thioredoxin
MVLMYGWYKGFKDFYQWQSAQQAKLPPDTYAEYLFYDIDGQTITQKTHKGKVVVFDFWTTSCGVCFQKFPEFERVYQKYKHRDDIAFYAVNLPTKRDTKESIMEVIARHVNYSFPVLLADKDFEYWREKFKIRGVPHLMIFDKNGEVFYSGWANYDKRIVYNIEDMIDKLLKL